MSSPDQAASVGTSLKLDAVVVVSETHDGDVRSCVERLRQAGVRVEVLPDVYAATAKLTKTAAVAAVLVDVRTLDDKELTFLKLVPRFFPKCSVLVPAFAGLEDRPAFHAPGMHMSPLEAMIESLIRDYAPEPTSERVEPEPAAIPTPDAQGQWPSAETELDAAIETEEGWEAPLEEDDSPEETAELVRDEPEPASVVETRIEPETPPTETVQERQIGLPTAPESEPQTPPPVEEQPRIETEPPRLSTDGGPEAAGSGPSMHEIVRRRMAADQEPTTRRTPPRSPPGGGATQPPENQEPPEATREGAVEPMLSPEELDALLTDRDEEERAGPPWTGTRGKP